MSRFRLSTRSRVQRWDVAMLILGALAAGLLATTIGSFWPDRVLLGLSILLVAIALPVVAGGGAPFETLGRLAAGAAVATIVMTALRPVANFTLSDLFLLIAAVTLMLSRPGWASLIPGWLPASAAILLLAGLTSSLGSTDPAEDLVFAVRLFVAVLFVPVTIGLAARTPRLLRLLATLFVLASAVSGVVGILDLTLGTDIAGSVATAAGTSEPKLGSEVFLHRAPGLTGHPNLLGVAAAMALPIAYWLVATSRTARGRTLTVLLFLTLVAGILASGSRAGLISGIFGVVLAWLLMRRRRLPQTKALVGILAAGSVALAVWSATGWGQQLSVGADRLADTSTRERNVAGRLSAFEDAIAAFKTKPITGTGFHNLLIAHDLYLQLLQSGGLIALFGFLVFVVGSMRLGIRLARDPELSGSLQSLACAATASTGVFFVAGLASPGFYDRWLYLPLGFLLGLHFLSRGSVGGGPRIRHVALESPPP